MNALRLTHILNVSNLAESFVWFEKLGWSKSWDWGTPPTFGGVCSGACEILLCENGQGGRGGSGFPATFGPDSNEAAEKAVKKASRCRPKISRKSSTTTGTRGDSRAHPSPSRWNA